MRWGLGEQPLSWVSSGKLPLRQLELNPEEDSGSLWSSTCTSECHQVSGRRGGGLATSLAPAPSTCTGELTPEARDGPWDAGACYWKSSW